MTQSTDRIGIKGSFVITAICNDGIIFSSESRGNIFDRTDTSQKPIAIYNSVQKVFPIGKLAIAATGQGLILNRFFSSIVQDFQNEVQQQPGVSNLLQSFLRFCEMKYPRAAIVEIKKQVLFAAGYENGNPVICYFNEQQGANPFGCIASGFIESNATTFRDNWSADTSCDASA